MHWQAMQFVTTIRSCFPQYFINRSVLEIGFYIVNDSVREVFQTDCYVGVDLVDGPGVDIISAGNNFLAEKSFYVVLSCEFFEHNPYYKETFLKMSDNLKPGGLFIFTCATCTSQASPQLSPGSSSVGWDYYRNLVKEDFFTLELGGIFKSYLFLTNQVFE